MDTSTFMTNSKITGEKSSVYACLFINKKIVIQNLANIISMNIIQDDQQKFNVNNARWTDLTYVWDFL